MLKMYGSASLLFAALVVAVPTARVVHERRQVSRHATWVKQGRATSSQQMPVRIALAQQNLEAGHDQLMDISRPDSPNFGKHMTQQEIADFFAPSSDAVNAVTEWLAASGIAAHRAKLSPSKQFIKFDASIGEMENLLQTSYHVYAHAEEGKSQVACEAYSIPQTVQGHIDFITPTVQVGKRLSRQAVQVADFAQEPHTQRLSEGTTCDKYLTPACIREKYDMPEGKAVEGNSFGIFELDDAYSPQSLDKAWLEFAPWVPQGTYPKLRDVSVNFSSSMREDGLESDLDFEIAIPLVYPQEVELYAVGHGKNMQDLEGFDMDPFLEAIDLSYCQMTHTANSTAPMPPACGSWKPANVISISYGAEEQAVPEIYAKRHCYEHMKLALQGVSTIVSSGDSGVGGNGRRDCKGRFKVAFPASCPYVTTLGGTRMGPKGFTDAEVALGSSSGTKMRSGGGFSEYFFRQEWQNATLEAFFANNTPAVNTSFYNPNGRAFPDVAAFAEDLPLMRGKGITKGSGTSASAPIFASMIVLINAERLERGKGPVGFLNPALYLFQDMFTDVISGSNPGCGLTGFEAGPGWDPVTGLGTPKYDMLKEALLKLP